MAKQHGNTWGPVHVPGGYRGAHEEHLTQGLPVVAARVPNLRSVPRALRCCCPSWRSCSIRWQQQLKRPPPGPRAAEAAEDSCSPNTSRRRRYRTVPAAGWAAAARGPAGRLAQRRQLPPRLGHWSRPGTLQQGPDDQQGAAGLQARRGGGQAAPCRCAEPALQIV